MSIADDLKRLQELHEKGGLTDREYAAAKAATLKGTEHISASRRLGRLIGMSFFPFLVIGLLVFAYNWFKAGGGTTSRMIATAVRAPVTLKDEIQSLPASSWKAVALELPYSGTINIELQVVRGNPIDVFLTTPDYAETIQKKEWGNVRVYGDFNAVKTTAYKRTGRLDQGYYYLVIRDTTLGILSSSTSDISVKAQLNP